MLIAYLRSRDLFILDGQGNTVFTDYLYWPDDVVTADRVLFLYGFIRTRPWQDHPRMAGIIVCEVKREEKKVR